jgi:hypothetical protein
MPKQTYNSTLLIGSNEEYLESVDESEEVEVITAEMKALREVAEAVLQSRKIISDEALRRALVLKRSSTSFSSTFVKYCIHTCLGEDHLLTIEGSSPLVIQRGFERLALHWSQWTQDRVTNCSLVTQEPLEDSTEELSIRYLSYAISYLMRDLPHEARTYFSRSLEVSSQLGLPITPLITWMLYTSFYIRGN